MSKLFSLNGKVIVITGGYGYLGVSISKGFKNAGAKVVVFGRNKVKFLEAFAGEKDIHFIKCDVSSTTSIKEAFVKTENDFGYISALINNAFYVEGGKIDEMSDQAWEITIDGVLNSVHRCIREVIPYFKKRQSGRIINVASMYGIIAPDFDVYIGYEKFINPPHYGAGKAAVIQLTKYFASLLGKERILVNCVSPGPFPSQTVQLESSFIEALSKKNPLGRIGSPDELQGIFIFLASESSSYITGQNISVDGGWTII